MWTAGLRPLAQAFRALTATGEALLRREPAAGGTPAVPNRRSSLDLSGPLQIVVHQRHRADALAGGGEDRVEHGGGRNRNRRLADAAPEIAGRHDDGLYPGHLVDAHDVVGV